MKITLRRTQAINDTKIQYLSVADKFYKVTYIDFCSLTIEASETALSITDIPENEIFPIEEFKEFRIRLINGGSDCDGMGKTSGDVIDFAEWIRTHNM